jgi:hypothetical protein
VVRQFRPSIPKKPIGAAAAGRWVNLTNRALIMRRHWVRVIEENRCLLPPGAFLNANGGLLA